MPLIMGSHKQLPVGQIYHPGCMTDENGNYIEPQPIFIIREATFEEWRDGLLGLGVEIETAGQNYYYEISTD